MVLECLSHYEDKLANPDIGQPFPQLYNLDTLEPLESWLDKYYAVCKALGKIGLNMNNN